MEDEKKAEEYAGKKCANCIRYYCKKQNKKIGSIDCCNEYLFQRKHFLAGLAEGRKENAELKAQIEKMKCCANCKWYNDFICNKPKGNGNCKNAKGSFLKWELAK